MVVRTCVFGWPLVWVEAVGVEAAAISDAPWAKQTSCSLPVLCMLGLRWSRAATRPHKADA